MSCQWILVIASLWMAGVAANEASVNVINQKMLRPDIQGFLNSEQNGELDKALARRAFVKSEEYKCDDLAEKEKRVACQLIELGDAAARQDMRLWAEKYRAFKQAIEKHDISLGRWDPYFSEINDDSLYQLSKVPPLEVIGEPTLFLPYRDGGQRVFGEKRVTMLTDTQDNEWLLDTGASHTLINADAAKKLNAQLLPGIQATLTPYHSNGRQQLQLAVIDRLEFENLSLKNVIVYVYSGESIIGLDLLKKAGRVAVAKQGLSRLSVEEFDARFRKCKAPVYLGSNIFTTQQFLFLGVSVEEQRHYAVLDTGIGGYLRRRANPDGNQAKFKNLDYNKDGVDASMGYYIARDVPMQIADVSKTVPIMDVFETNYPAPLLLGTDALSDFDLLMDYGGRRACLSEQLNSVKVGSTNGNRIKESREALRSKDYSQALTLAREEVDANHSPAAYNILGAMYLLGLGVQTSRTQAIDYYGRAASGGLVSAQATLGALYLQDAKSNADVERAKKWLTKAAEGNTDSALYNLGLIHEQGLTGTKDLNLAVDYFKKASALGYTLAKVRLGVLYQSGLVKPEKEQDAITLFQEASESGSPFGAFFLAKSYGTGEGVSKRFDLAAKWYLVAAQRGVPMAQANIASMYEQGLGVNKDALAAYKWYWLASSKMPAVLPRLDVVKTQLSPADVERLDTLKKAWPGEVENTVEGWRMTIAE